MGGAMSAATTAAALAATAAATASASVAAARSPEPRDNPTLADVLSISVFMAVFFPLFVVLLAFACLHLFVPRDDDRLPAPDDSAASASDRSLSLRGGKGGLDAAAIAALPLVFYREVRRHRVVVDGRDDALECSVCLLEFDDDDALRLLPTCPHAFHPDCIALWLERHPTCPLCRANVRDEPLAPAQRELELQPVAPLPLQSPEASPVHATVALIVSGASQEGGEEEDDEEEWTTIQRLARNRRAAGRQALPRSNSTGHGGASASGGGMDRFALRLPEHVRVEIFMSHRLRHVTSAVASVRVREGSAASAHDGSTVGGSVRNAVARLMSLFAPGGGWKADGDDRSGRGDATGASSFRRRDNSSRGAVAEEKRSV